jgi:carbonic anhydrase
MEMISYLQQITQGTKTLVITCMECCLDIEQQLDGNVYRLTTLGNMVNLKDEFQMQSIESFVEFKKCSKIIIAGHSDCRVLNSILYHPLSEGSPLRFAKSNLSEIFSGNHCHMLKDDLRDRILIEQNIIKQCRTLLGHKPFIKKCGAGLLDVIGLLIDTNGGCKQVFSHRMSYNNIVAMN